MIVQWVAFAFLRNGLPLPLVAGAPFVWHTHELLFGFTLAAVAGFARTAILEFTGPAFVPARPVRALFALWLASRAGFWSGAWLGLPILVVAGFAHLGLIAGLVALLAPLLFSDPERKHLSFLWALAAFTVLRCSRSLRHSRVVSGKPLLKIRQSWQARPKHPPETASQG
ncbi:MAG: NnrS family protein [Candidatus Accumulibacter sp.]|uniref:NnrS family protein n=1 Tax=Candidatus Accumulibacter cognatus TaxID=2954383 RepID=A0A7D5NGR3_9PROT|nr:NnrS family protein [Accumulibacter sp.]MBN8517814.1 NnrS family protein [Accumulibacter sp.]MBO3711145.1 NnrS family protein [Accumulibacter sp.]MCC2868421.1 NnrS family protein [Candidatus Accumulibacter phosphatis]QLH52551.1 MAG: NnrS family protein [Candidatus Accumulibacter cognatus]